MLLADDCSYLTALGTVGKNKKYYTGVLEEMIIFDLQVHVIFIQQLFIALKFWHEILTFSNILGMYSNLIFALSQYKSLILVFTSV